MNIDLTKLIDLSYLFEKRPNPESAMLFGLAIIAGLMIIGSGITWIAYVRKERTLSLYRSIRERLVRWLFTGGFVTLILIFFRFEGIPYFGSRAWLFLWGVVLAIWSVTILIYILKKFPKERSLYQEQVERSRYLPKSKRVSTS